MFKETRTTNQFEWSMLGDIGAGRPNLGSIMDVAAYRLMQFTLRDTLIAEFDPQTADRIFFRAGEQAESTCAAISCTRAERSRSSSKSLRTFC